MCWGMGTKIQLGRRYSTTVSWGLILLLLQCVTRPIGGNPLGTYRKKQGHVQKPYYHHQNQRPFLSFLESETNVEDYTEGLSDNGASLEEFHQDPIVQGIIEDKSGGLSDTAPSLEEFHQDPVAQGMQGKSARAEFEEVAYQWLLHSSSRNMLFEDIDKKPIMGESDEYHFSSADFNRDLVGVEDIVGEGFERDRFIDLCYANLTADATKSKGDSITTTDIFEFLIGICEDNQDCSVYYPYGIPLNYDGLDVNIQLEWLWTICPPSWRSSAACLEDLQEEQGIDDYGLILTETNKWINFNKTLDFCTRIWPYRQHTDGKFIQRDCLT